MGVPMKLHAAGEDYLEAILVLQKKQGMVRFVDVARYVEVSKPSVYHAMTTLREGGFLTMDSDYFLHLTNVGRGSGRKNLRASLLLLPSSLLPQALTPRLWRPTPAVLNTSSAMRVLTG